MVLLNKQTYVLLEGAMYKFKRWCSCIEFKVLFFKMIWLYGSLYFYLYGNNVEQTVTFFVFTFLLYMNEGKNINIYLSRKHEMNRRGIFILIPFVVILNYVYSMLGLNIVITDTEQLFNVALFIIGCTFLMVIFCCRLREFRWGTFYIKNRYCVIISGILFGVLLGNLAYIPLGIVMTYLYAKYNYSLLIALCTILCITAPFPVWRYSILYVIASAFVIILLRKRLQNYGYPIYLSNKVFRYII